MKALRYLKGTTWVATLCLTVTGSNAAPPPAPKAAANAAKRTAPEAAEPEIPQSVFTIPSHPSEGKDPFFPNRQPVPPVVVPGPRTNQVVTLTVNGIIPGANPLVMINGRTFAPGETGEVSMGPGRPRQRLTCVEIKLDSVVIDVNGERRELRLKNSLK